MLLVLPMLLHRLLPAYRQTKTGVAVPFLAQLAALTGQQPAPGAIIIRPPLIQRLCLGIMWLCIVAAIARLQWPEKPLTKTLPTRDLLLAVDLSGSMETQDFTNAAGQHVDRLTAVKEVLDDFLTARKGDRVGLIFFGSAAFVQTPFTEDLDAYRTLLDEAQVRMTGPKTALSDAIGLALTVFAHDQGIRDRVLIVLTDGNDTGSQVPPIRAAEVARDQKITIHTVAVGDPTAAGEGKLDEETLKAVAATTGGRNAHANDQAALADIYAQLDALRTREVQTVSHRPRRELFHWPLGVGVLLSLVYHLAWAVRTGLRRKFGIPATAAAPVGMAAVLPMATGLSQFHFLRPWWLLALIPALWLVWMICRHQDAARPWRGVIVDHLLPYLLAEGGPRRRLQPVHLLLLIWFLAILSLSGPTWQREPAPFADDEAALVIALEVTPTMLAQDVQPSRLDRAAQKIRDLLAERPGIRTALVAYAGSTHLVMPLTRDADLITRFAAELSPTIMPVAGDVADEALAVPQEQLRKSGLRGSMLLITDGVSAEQLPQLAAYHKNGGAPVQILAVAASAGVPVPPNSPPAPALDREALDNAAEALDATLTIVGPDDSDVRWLARHTATSLVVTSAEQTGERWKDAGYWLVFGVAALAGWCSGHEVTWMNTFVQPKNLLRAVLLLAFVGASICAWQSAGRSFANLWLTPDHQGARLMSRQQYGEAAKHFRDPLWRGAALYRDGQFKEVAAAFARVDSPEAAFDRGNALVMLGKYSDAIASYNHALQQRSDWREAKANRDLAEARRQRLEPPKDDAGGTGGQLEADAIVFDDRPQKSGDAPQVEVVTGGELSDAQLQALWLRRVQTMPADFLHAKFAYQLSRRQQEKPQP